MSGQDISNSCAQVYKAFSNDIRHTSNFGEEGGHRHFRVFSHSNLGESYLDILSSRSGALVDDSTVLIRYCINGDGSLIKKEGTYYDTFRDDDDAYSEAKSNLDSFREWSEEHSWLTGHYMSRSSSAIQSNLVRSELIDLAKNEIQSNAQQKPANTLLENYLDFLATKPELATKNKEAIQTILKTEGLDEEVYTAAAGLTVKLFESKDTDAADGFFGFSASASPSISMIQDLKDFDITYEFMMTKPSPKAIRDAFNSRQIDENTLATLINKAYPDARASASASPEDFSNNIQEALNQEDAQTNLKDARDERVRAAIHASYQAFDALDGTRDDNKITNAALRKQMRQTLVDFLPGTEDDEMFNAFISLDDSDMELSGADTDTDTEPTALSDVDKIINSYNELPNTRASSATKPSSPNPATDTTDKILNKILEDINNGLPTGKTFKDIFDITQITGYEKDDLIIKANALGVSDVFFQDTLKARLSANGIDFDQILEEAFSEYSGDVELTSNYKVKFTEAFFKKHLSAELEKIRTAPMEGHILKQPESGTSPSEDDTQLQNQIDQILQGTFGGGLGASSPSQGDIYGFVPRSYSYQPRSSYYGSSYSYPSRSYYSPMNHSYGSLYSPFSSYYGPSYRYY